MVLSSGNPVSPPGDPVLLEVDIPSASSREPTTVYKTFLAMPCIFGCDRFHFYEHYFLLEGVSRAARRQR